MKLLIKTIVCLAAILLQTCAALGQTTAEPLKIAHGTAIAVDGLIEDAEWRGASAFELAGGGKVFFKHDGEYFYVGLRGLRDGWAQIYLSEGESADVYVLHASAALGMSLYRADRNRLWQPANDFAWELRDRVVNDETRGKMKKYLAANNWVANNNNMNRKNEVEFQIKPRDPADRRFLVALEYVTGDEKQYFPAALADDTLKSKLALGFAAPDLKFDQRQWARIVLENKK